MGTILDDLLQANQRYAAGFNQGGLAMPPARKLAIVTCMDARVEPLSFLGLRLGDTHVIRNAGGRVTEDAIRSLTISERAAAWHRNHPGDSSHRLWYAHLYQ